MSLLDKLKDKALAAVLDEDRQREWVEEGFDKALERAREALPVPGDSPEVAAIRESATYALDRLADKKDSLVLLGSNGLRAALMSLAMGDYEGAAKHAALVTLRETASWGEVSAAITTAAEAGNQKTRDLNQARAEMLTLFKSIGMAAAKAALPFILAI